MSEKTLRIDGSQGEGGGQVLRTSLTLAMATGRPVTIDNVRSGRKKPGLRSQHLTAVLAAQAVSGAAVDGAELGSTRLAFAPGPVRGGDYRFAVGTAGSTTLVLQTLLPVLATAPEATRLALEGGTHNPMAPPFDFLARAFLPLFERMGPEFTVTLVRPGFYPAGGGEITVAVTPAAELRGFDLLDAGRLRRRAGRALLARLPRHIAEREVKVMQKRLGWPPETFTVEELEGSKGPGNAVVIELEHEHVTEVVTAFGAIGVTAEKVAARAVRELRRYRKAGVPVGEHLADQLILPLALAGGGRFRTLPLSRHATTQMELVRRFLEAEIAVEPSPREVCVVRIARSRG